MLDIQVYH